MGIIPTRWDQDLDSSRRKKDRPEQFNVDSGISRTAGGRENRLLGGRIIVSKRNWLQKKLRIEDCFVETWKTNLCLFSSRSYRPLMPREMVLKGVSMEDRFLEIAGLGIQIRADNGRFHSVPV